MVVMTTTVVEDSKAATEMMATTAVVSDDTTAEVGTTHMGAVGLSKEAMEGMTTTAAERDDIKEEVAAMEADVPSKAAVTMTTPMVGDAHKVAIKGATTPTAEKDATTAAAVHRQAREAAMVHLQAHLMEEEARPADRAMSTTALPSTLRNTPGPLGTVRYSAMLSGCSPAIRSVCKTKT